MDALDLHCQMILEEYREALPTLERMQAEVLDTLRKALERNGLVVTAVETRIKTEESLAGKLALKGGKYPPSATSPTSSVHGSSRSTPMTWIV